MSLAFAFNSIKLGWKVFPKFCIIRLEWLGNKTRICQCKQLDVRDKENPCPEQKNGAGPLLSLFFCLEFLKKTPGLKGILPRVRADRSTCLFTGNNRSRYVPVSFATLASVLPDGVFLTLGFVKVSPGFLRVQLSRPIPFKDAT